MALKLILARARNGTIGKNNTLPWHLPEDLAHFKRTTMGSPVIMGRNTWESIPEKFRPLPGRMNFILSNTITLEQTSVRVVKSLDEAIDITGINTDLWVIGGALVYEQCMNRTTEAVITEIDADFEGDAKAPVFDKHWVEVSRTRHTAANGLVYSIVYLKNPQGV